MSKLYLVAAAAAASLSAATPAAAALITFDGAGLTAAGYITGGGSFTLPDADGTYGLDPSLGFEASGISTFIITLGSASFTQADLQSFSATLSGGALSAISFSTKPVTATSLFGNTTAAFSVNGFGNNNTRVFVGGRSVGRIDTAFSVTPSAVPEPATWAMMLTGLGLAGYAMRRRRAKTAQPALA